MCFTKERDQPLILFPVLHFTGCVSLFVIHFRVYSVCIVVVVPDTGGTRCMVECPQCLGLLVCCHPDPLLHPPDTTTPLLARFLLIEIWLPGNRLQMDCTVIHFICSLLLGNPNLKYPYLIHPVAQVVKVIRR